MVTLVMSLLTAPAREWLGSLALPDDQAFQVAQSLACLALSHESFEDTVLGGSNTLLALPLEPGVKHAVRASLAALKVGAMPDFMHAFNSISAFLRQAGKQPL